MATTLQPSDEKILVGGYFTSYNTRSVKYLVRLDKNGNYDDSFNVGTGFNNVVRSIALQPGGKILVGGDFTSYNDDPVSYIVRLNPDGSRDETFTQTGSGLDQLVNDIAVQPDGKILAGGYFRNYNGDSASNIIRFNTDGTRDPSFVQPGVGLAKS